MTTMTPPNQHADPADPTTAWERTESLAAMPSPLKRGVVYLVALIVIATMALLYFGRAHVVVTGRGRIVPEGDVILVQAIQGGVVSGLLAKAGDRLPAGAPIVKLDVGESGVGVTELEQKADALEDQIAKLTATVAVINQIVADPERALVDTKVLSVATVGNVAQTVNDLENLRARLDGARRAVTGWPSRRAASVREIELTRDNVALNEKSYATQVKLLESGEAALAQKQAQLTGFRALAERRLISSLELGAEEEKVRAAEGATAEARRRVEQLAVDISNQKIKLADLEGRMAAEPSMREGAVRQAESALRQTLALLRQEGANLGLQLTEAESNLQATRARLGMAQDRVALTSVVMPVAGMISELKVSNTGELLGAGALVATVVPDGVPLVVEASVSNRDVGFVKPGIDARIKVDAYPFQQFGTLAARVRTVVPGTGNDNSFTVTLDLLESRISASDRELPLFPGLAVDAELLTARQRIITRLLSAGSVWKRDE